MPFEIPCARNPLLCRSCVRDVGCNQIYAVATSAEVFPGGICPHVPFFKVFFLFLLEARPGRVFRDAFEDMRRSTRSGCSYGADTAAEASAVGVPVGSEGAGGKKGQIEQPPSQRPLLRGWVPTLSVPYSLLMGYYIVLHAPAAGSAKVVGLTSVSCAVQYAVHAYYHIVFHPPARRAFVRKFDHASIFLTIASIYTPFVYRAYEQTGQGWMLALLAVEWALALAGVANSIGGLVPNMKKLHRTLLYVAVAWTPVPAACFTFGWGAYRWVALGGLAYMSGGAMYAAHWPNPMPGVFGYHELMHLSNIIAHTLMMRGLIQAYLQY